MAEPVDIILLSFNRHEFLAEMVDKLEQRTVWPYRLTIVDNASGPATREWLRANAERFHQIIWNERNEHLAGLQRGIAATDGELFVLSDADLVVSEPQGGECWLTRLRALAERHPDFGLLSVRLDTVSAARNAHLERAAVIDGEVIEAASGVWLNLIRRAALRIPYVSDGITAHALRRSGYRVGVAAQIYATHLGDEDPRRHPDYLARKQAASGWRTAYPDYPELADSAPPPTLHQLALAAPVIGALESRGVTALQALELASGEPILSAVWPAAVAIAPGAQPPAGARAIVVFRAGEQRLLERAFAAAAELVIIAGTAATPPATDGWSLAAELAGPQRVMLALADRASRPRWRRRLLYSTSEHRDHWLSVFRAACFGEDPAFRVYVYEREAPLALHALEPRRGAVARRGLAPGSRGRRLGTLATKLRRLVVAEWRLLRGRGR